LAKYYLQLYQILPSEVIHQSHGLQGLQPISPPALPNSPFPALDLKLPFRLRCYASNFTNGIEAITSEYSLPIVLEKIYENQIALEAAIMELLLLAERQGIHRI